MTLADFMTWISLFLLFWDFGILSVSSILILSVRDGPGSHSFCLCLIYKQWEGLLRLQMFSFSASTGKGRAISSSHHWKQMNGPLNPGLCAWGCGVCLSFKWPQASALGHCFREPRKSVGSQRLLSEESEEKYSSFLWFALPFTSCVTQGKSFACLTLSFNSMMKL